MNILSMEEYKENRNKKKLEETYSEIKNELKEFENAKEIIDILPKNFQLKLVKYLLENYVNLNELRIKDDDML